MSEQFDALVDYLRGNPEHAQRLATLHALDGRGRCTVCRTGNHNTGHTHGCQLGAAARQALEG